VDSQPLLITRRAVIMACGVIAAARISSAASGKPAPAMKVYRNPGCGCCEKWVTKMRTEGFAATIEDRDDLDQMKKKLGIPDDLAACHTGLVAGYVLEGHVPVDDVRRLLRERPAALGLAVPGMPVGSPGMEGEDGTTEPFVVWLFEKNGERRQFAKHG
jgi:hypothetical protein